MRVVAPLPASCYKCSSITYCSPKCRDADEPLHRLECGILGPLWYSKASVTCFLALRAIIQRPYEEFVKIKQQKLELGKEPYLGKNYKTFCNLGESYFLNGFLNSDNLIFIRFFIYSLNFLT